MTMEKMESQNQPKAENQEANNSEPNRAHEGGFIQDEFLDTDQDGNLKVGDRFDPTEGDNDGKKDRNPKSDPHQDSDHSPTLKRGNEDGLGFNCDVCSDRNGGCTQCGFGRKK